MLRTPCFASDFVLCFGVVLCFDDVVLCFARRRTSCCASTTRSAFRSRSGLLCVTPCFAPSREVATQRRWVNFLAFCRSLPLLPLPLSPLVEVLAFPCLLPFLVPFSQGDHRRQQEGPGLRLRAFDVPSSTCFFWRCKPSNRKILRASRRFVLPAL